MSKWTPERVERVRSLVREGLSAAQIAASLGGEITRGAVIGVMHRHNLTGRTGLGRQYTAAASEARRKKAAPSMPVVAALAEPPREVVVPEPEPPREPPPPPQLSNGFLPPTTRKPPSLPEDEPPPVDGPAPEGVHLFDLAERSCRWPLWGAKDHPPVSGLLFCGDPKADGLVYCPHHARIAYRSVAEARAASKEAFSKRDPAKGSKADRQFRVSL